MEGRELISRKSPSRHKPLRRSLSAQPEVSTLSSSPYSTRKKLKYPGRSLTEIFTSKHDRSERASSDDFSGLHRRTSSACPSSLSQLKQVREDSDWVSPDRSLVSDFGRFSSLPVYKVPAVNDESDAYGSCYQTSSIEVYGKLCLRSKREVSELTTDVVGSCASPSRKKLRINGDRRDDKEKNCEVVQWKLLKLIFKFLFWLIVSVLSVLLLIIGTTTFFAYIEALCHQKMNVILPLHDLRFKLTQDVIGQEIATDIILSSLRGIRPGHVGMPFIMWIVGGTGSGKTLAAHILKDVLADVFPVHVLIASLLPPDEDNLENEISSLFNKLDSCSPSLIIIDGWDEQNNTPVKALQNILVNYHNYRSQGYEKGQIVIMLSGTRGSQEIDSLYTELRQSGKARADLGIENFSALTTIVEEAKVLRAVTKQYVFVPFLPLEVSHVKRCVKNELLKSFNMDIVVQEEDVQKISRQVLDQLTFIPKSYPLLATTGCKRVLPLLSLLHPGSSLL